MSIVSPDWGCPVCCLGQRLHSRLSRDAQSNGIFGCTTACRWGYLRKSAGIDSVEVLLLAPDMDLVGQTFFAGISAAVRSETDASTGLRRVKHAGDEEKWSHPQRERDTHDLWRLIIQPGHFLIPHACAEWQLYHGGGSRAPLLAIRSRTPLTDRCGAEPPATPSHP